MAWLRQIRGLALGAVSFAYLVFVLNPIQVASILVYPFSRRLCRNINRWCARSIWGFWVLLAERINGTRVHFSGDDIPPRENALLLPNHQGMADVLLLLSLSWRCGRIGDLKWFVKDPVKYVPGPGWGMKLLDCVYVKRDWAKDRAGIERLFAKYRRNDIPIFLVSFLEGTRRTPDKLAAAQDYARTHGHFVPSHTLVPRTKGFVATMRGLRDHLDAVYDITIGYPERTPSLVDCFSGKVPRVEVHVRRYAVDALPEDDDALAAWVFDRFVEKDARMAAFAGEQQFPPPRRCDVVEWGEWFQPERQSAGLVTATAGADEA